MCKHTDCVHVSDVGLREQAVYGTIIANTVGTVSDGQEYRTLELFFKKNGRVYLVLEGNSNY